MWRWFPNSRTTEQRNAAATMHVVLWACFGSPLKDLKISNDLRLRLLVIVPYLLENKVIAFSPVLENLTPLFPKASGSVIHFTTIF